MTFKATRQGFFLMFEYISQNCFSTVWATDLFIFKNRNLLNWFYIKISYISQPNSNFLAKCKFNYKFCPTIFELLVFSLGLTNKSYVFTFLLSYSHYSNGYFVESNKSYLLFPTDFSILSHVGFISFTECTTCSKSNLWTSYQQQQHQRQRSKKASPTTKHKRLGF